MFFLFFIFAFVGQFDSKEPDRKWVEREGVLGYYSYPNHLTLFHHVLLYPRYTTLVISCLILLITFHCYILSPFIDFDFGKINKTHSVHITTYIRHNDLGSLLKYTHLTHLTICDITYWPHPCLNLWLTQSWFLGSLPEKDYKILQQKGRKKPVAKSKPQKRPL